MDEFNFYWKPTFNISLKLLKNIENIRFDNQRQEPNVFSMSIYKNNKVMKTIRRKPMGGSWTSLNINSNGAEVLWPIGSNDKHKDFPKAKEKIDDSRNIKKHKAFYQ